MKREKSCGAVIFRADSGKFLIEKMKKGHVSLCKGHVEGNETEHETAVREIKEETNLTVSFIDGFRESIEYSPYKGCVKEVIFFAAEATSFDAVPQEEEVSELYWLGEEEALEILTHASDRRVLKKAAEFLREKGQL